MWCVIGVLGDVSGYDDHSLLHAAIPVEFAPGLSPSRRLMKLWAEITRTNCVLFVSQARELPSRLRVELNVPWCAASH